MKEIIELLAECNEFIEENPSEYGLELPVSDVKIIAAALEKQISEKPIGWNCECLDCTTTLLAEANYCHYCGKAIDWGDEE